MRATFRPEFLNRVDETILFHRLERRHIERIVRIQLGQMAERLRGRRIELSVTAAACDYLAERGFDPQFGARPLKRTLTSLVQNPLARRLIAGEVADGSTVLVDLVGRRAVLPVRRSRRASGARGRVIAFDVRLSVPCARA